MQRLHGTVAKPLSAGPPAKARKVPVSNKIQHDWEGRGGGSSSETPVGGCDPPVGCRILWQFVNWNDKWGTCTWQDFSPEWSDNVEEVFLEAASAPGGFEKNVPQFHVPDHEWSGSTKKKGTTLYRYDFLKMKQINEKTDTVRDIRRLAVLRSA